MPSRRACLVRLTPPSPPLECGKPCPGGSAITPPAIALIPLDDRPCNRLFPHQLSLISGCQLHLPPRDHLGWFDQPGDPDAIADWLRSCPADRLVISLDMWCFGGLVASRFPRLPLDLALQRLTPLRELRQARPDMRIFAFSNVMRLGTFVTSPDDLAVHEGLLAYSQLIDRVERLGEEQARPELEAVIAQLDRDRLADYLAARRRNHAVNRAAIQLVADAVFDYLVLAQEDAAPVGLHMPELMALRDQVEEFRIADRVAIHPGADEVGLVLLARHHLDCPGPPIGLSVDYASAEGADIIPQYEHQPLRQTVESQIRAAGARLAPPVEADALLFLHTPVHVQHDIAEAPPEGHSPALAAQADSVAERTTAAAASGLPLGLADLAYANGMDPELIAAFRRTGGLHHLTAFAGWNTAANTLGTVIAQLCLALSSAPERRESVRRASRRFLACRLLDDYAYQSSVRSRAVERAAELGANPYALADRAAELETFVREQLAPFSHEMHSSLLAGPAAAATPPTEGSPPTAAGPAAAASEGPSGATPEGATGAPPDAAAAAPAGETAGPAPGEGEALRLADARVTLPWGRLFEVEVEIPS